VMREGIALHTCGTPISAVMPLEKVSLSECGQALVVYASDASR